MATEFLTAVNLLPWREHGIRQERRRLMLQLAGAMAFALGVVVLGAWQIQRLQVASESEIARLRAQMAAHGQRAAAAQVTVNEIARWKALTSFEPVARASQQRILDFLRDVSAQSVAGIALQSVEFSGEVIAVKGATRSKSLAVDLVRGLKARGWPVASPTVAASESKIKDFQFLVKPKERKKK